VGKKYLRRYNTTMVVLAYLLIGLHIVLCVALTYFVLKQMKKTSELGGSFGGGGNTTFGRKKGLDTVGKITLGLAIAFMTNSVVIAWVIYNAFPSVA